MARATSCIVITGASGFIGTSLSHMLAARGTALRLVSRFPRRAALGPIEHVAANLEEERSWDEIIADATAVILLSARTDLRAAEADPLGDERINVVPVRNLVNAARRAARKDLTVVFASTVTVVGDRHTNPVGENTLDNPISTYARHKLVCERILGCATR
ncbi:MAG: NAD-dependent epimerase/dehydratase family protein, partial [Methyloceanibacter sp.]